MKKTCKALLFIIFSLWVAYSISWFVVATFVKNQLIREKEQLKKHDIFINHDGNISFGGYPNKIKFIIPAFKLEAKNHKIESEKLVIDTNILVRKINIEFGENTTVKSERNILRFDYMNAPKLHLKFSKSMIMGTVPSDLHSFLLKLASASYSDNGFVMVDIASEKPVVTNYKTTMSVSNKIQDNKHIDNISISSSWQDSEKEFDKVDLFAENDLNFYFNDKNHLVIDALNVKEVSIKSEKYSMLLDGEFNNQKDLGRASLLFNVSLNNYEFMLDVLSKKHIVGDLETSKKLLQKIASVDESQKDIKFVIKNNDDKDLMIGNMSIPQIVLFYYNR